MTTITLGEVRIDRVVEIGRSSFPTTSMLPDATGEGIARHRGWLAPFWDESTDDLGSRIQSYVVRTPGHTVLMDTCVGNDKHRDGAPHKRGKHKLPDDGVVVDKRFEGCAWSLDNARPQEGSRKRGGVQWGLGLHLSRLLSRNGLAKGALM